MSCTSPRPALIPFNGGRPKFLIDDMPVGVYGKLGRVVYLPCGGCIACRRERRQDLTVLQMAEASLYDENWFLTLTYDDERYFRYFQSKVDSLHKSHLQVFCESMRKWAKFKGLKFRFYACGEYGEKFGRPHYHMSIFGLSSEDLCLQDDLSQDYRKSSLLIDGHFRRSHSQLLDSNGNQFWQSPVISYRWPYGNHQIYRASRETFQYVAGYVTKKLTGKAGRDFRATGKESEFSLQSRPSIGFPFYEKYKSNLSLIDGSSLVNDSLSVGDLSWRIPRIFDKWRTRQEGDITMNELKRIRSLGSPLQPNRIDLKRKADYDRYSVKRYQETNRSHKEIK